MGFVLLVLDAVVLLNLFDVVKASSKNVAQLLLTNRRIEPIIYIEGHAQRSQGEECTMIVDSRCLREDHKRIYLIQNSTRRNRERETERVQQKQRERIWGQA